jgi:hypothetical protein
LKKIAQTLILKVWLPTAEIDEKHDRTVHLLAMHLGPKDCEVLVADIDIATPYSCCIYRATQLPLPAVIKPVPFATVFLLSRLSGDCNFSCKTYPITVVGFIIF